MFIFTKVWQLRVRRDMVFSKLCTWPVTKKIFDSSFCNILVLFCICCALNNFLDTFCGNLFSWSNAAVMTFSDTHNVAVRAYFNL